MKQFSMLYALLCITVVPYMYAEPITRSVGLIEYQKTIVLRDLPSMEENDHLVPEPSPLQRVFKQAPIMPVDEQDAASESAHADVFQQEEKSSLEVTTRCVPSLPLLESFQALNDSLTTIPPDTQGTVGLNDLMTMLNDRVRIQTKTGLILSTVSLSSFWGVSAFDPHVAYDPFNNRWIASALSNEESPNSQLLLAVSQTSDPLGGWNIHYIKADATSQSWADFDTLGFNSKWIVIQANMFGVSTGAFNGSHIYVFDKAALYNSNLTHFTLFNMTSSFGATQMPALTYDNTSPTLYLLQNWTGNAFNNGYLRLYAINGSVGAENLTSPGFIIITNNTWASAHPIISKGFAPQVGTPLRIMNNDSRILSFVVRNGSGWAAQNVFLPASSPTHTAVQWLQFNPVSRAIQQFGRIQDPLANLSSGTFYAFPSIAVNAANDVMIGYSFFSPQIHPSSAYSFRYGIDPLNLLRCSTTLKAGLDIYTKDFGSGQIRWGDYSNTVIDPVGIGFWTIQESSDLAISSTSRWLTWWGNILPTT